MTNLIQSQIFDNEILMASFYHSAYAAAADVSASTGVKWCTVFNNEVDAAVVDLKAVKGFDGHSKCTWQISAKDGLKSVGFILKESEVVDYFIHFIEWQKTSAFSANQILPTADGPGYNIGAYPTTDGLFLNPAPTDLAAAADTTWKAGGAYSFYESADPSKVFVGDTQPLNFFPNSEGSQKTTQSLTVDFGLVSYVNKGRQAEISSWNSLKDSYEGKKKAYNQAIDDETARRADLFKALFEAPIEIPERPCPPTAMGSFSTWTSDLTTFSPSAASATTWDHTNAKNMFNMVNYKAYARGWLEASSDKGDKAKMYADVGKVFGVFGRGTANTPDGAKAFTWNKPAAADKSGIQISIYPETDATAGLTAAAKYIHFQAKTVEFAGMADALPSVASPAAPGAPNAALGAQTLAAGMIAIASVYASLY